MLLAYAAAMIKAGFASAVLTLMLAGACARAGAGPSDASVPAGCAPVGDRVAWSPARTTPMLVKADLYEIGDLAAGATGTALLNDPFTPSISGVDAPAPWLAELGDSLTRHTGQPVHTDAPSAEGQSFGVLSTAQDGPAVLYIGVNRISADFAVRCDRTVRGALTAWIKVVASGVSCGYTSGVQLDVFGREALKLCPNPPASPPAEPSDALEFPTGRPVS